MEIISEAEIKKQISLIRNELQQISQGADIQKHMHKVISWYIESQHRVIKLACFPLLKSFNNLDYKSIFDTISNDLVSKDDEIQLNTLKILYQIPHDLAIKILTKNEKEFLQILDNSDEFHYERLITLHDFLMKAYLKNFSMDQREDCSESIEIADQLFTNIQNQNQQNSPASVTNKTRQIIRDSIEIFMNLYQAYINSVSDFNTVDHYFDGNGSIRQILQQLVIKLTNYFLPRLDALLKKVLSYELRLRSHLLTFIVYLLEAGFQFLRELYEYRLDALGSPFTQEMYLIKQKAGNVLDLREFFQKFLEVHLLGQVLLATQEPEVTQGASLNVFRLLSLADQFFLLPKPRRGEIVWLVFEHFHQTVYRKELTTILLNLASQSTCTSTSQKLCIAFQVLEVAAKNQPGQFARFLLMLVGCFNLVECSLKLLSLNKPSCIFSLFKWLQGLKEENVSDVGNLPTLIREELVSSLILSCIYARVQLSDTTHYSRVLMEVLDVSYGAINWKYAERASLNDVYNKTIMFAIDVYLILLEEAIDTLEDEQIRVIIIELIKRINHNEINFLPKLKSIFIIAKHFDKHSMVMALNFATILSDFRAFMIQPLTQSMFFEKNLNALQSSSELIKFLSNLEMIFCCCYYFSLKFSTVENELIINIIQLISDFLEHLKQLLKTKGTLAPIIQTVMDYAITISDYISSQESVDILGIEISREFTEQLDDSSSFSYVTGKKPPAEPKEQLYAAFNILSQGICKSKLLFQADSVDSDDITKHFKTLHLRLQREESLSFHAKLDQQPILITGVSDFLQIYASHSTFLYKSLVSVNLKLVNMNSFRIEGLRLKLLCSQGADVFPQSTNPRVQIVEELLPFSVRQLSFCLHVEEARSLLVSFEILVDIETGVENEKDIAFRTQQYKLGVLEFLMPNCINALSKHFFQYVWSDICSSFKVKCVINCAFPEIWAALRRKPLSCVILEGDSSKEQSLLQNLSINPNLSQLQNKTLTIGMLGITWDGASLALNIRGISSDNLNNIVGVEIKSTKPFLLEVIKSQLDEFIEELSDGLIVQIL